MLLLLMRFKIRNQVKLVTVLLLCVVLYNEYLVYIFQSFKWPSLKCSHKDCVKILFVADPQVLGEQIEDAPLKYLVNWDSDRYLTKTYAQAISHFRPEVIIFLGDIMDEGTIATTQEFDMYFKRVLSIFHTDDPIKYIWLPGDNDIGGENEPIYPNKVKQFNSAFNQPDLFSIKNVDIYKVSIIVQVLPHLAHKISTNRTNIAVSHKPLLLSPGKFTEYVFNNIHPSVIFSGHKHSALHLRTTLETMFVSKVVTINPYDKNNVIHIDFKQNVFHEFVVPTCSYRMGVPNMGYGIGIIDENVLEYSVLWSPRRFDQLQTYLLALFSAAVYLAGITVYKIFMFTFYKGSCRRTSTYSRV